MKNLLYLTHKMKKMIWNIDKIIPIRTKVRSGENLRDVICELLIFNLIKVIFEKKALIALLSFVSPMSICAEPIQIQPTESEKSRFKFI
jgi:hypothetical protein